jgi:hypothetical protein
MLQLGAWCAFEVFDLLGTLAVKSHEGRVSPILSAEDRRTLAAFAVEP